MVEAQDEPAPFLYYYSEAERTFVIERADGTDSRILSQVQMPENTTDVRIVGWSPSGEWLAWTGRSTLLGGNTFTTAWAANLDGVRALAMLAEAGNVYTLTWSPTEDILFVAGRDSPTDRFGSLSTPSNHHFLLVNATTQNILAISEMEVSFEDFDHTPVWSSDGQYLTFTFTPPTDKNRQSFLRRVSRTGEIEDIPIPHPVEDAISFVDDYPTDYWVLTQSEDARQLIAVNAFSGESISFDVPAPINDVFSYQWNDDQDHVLIYVRTPRSGDHFELWLLSVTDQTLQSLKMDAKNYANESGTWVAWLRSSNNAVFYTEDGLYGVTLEPQVEIFQILATSFVAPVGARTETQFYFAAQVADDAGELRTVYFVYDFADDTLTERAASDLQFAFTNGDQRFTVLENPFSVLDREQNLTYSISPDSRAQIDPYYRLEGIDWYRASSWFLTLESELTGQGRRYTSVNNAYGTVHREIAQCYYSCAGWLPDNVLAHVEAQ